MGEQILLAGHLKRGVYVGLSNSETTQGPGLGH